MANLEQRVKARLALLQAQIQLERTARECVRTGFAAEQCLALEAAVEQMDGAERDVLVAGA